MLHVFRCLVDLSSAENTELWRGLSEKTSLPLHVEMGWQIELRLQITVFSVKTTLHNLPLVWGKGLLLSLYYRWWNRGMFKLSSVAKTHLKPECPSGSSLLWLQDTVHLNLPSLRTTGLKVEDHPFEKGSVLVFVLHLEEHSPEPWHGLLCKIATKIIIETTSVIGETKWKIPTATLCGRFPSCWSKLEYFVFWLTNSSQAEAEQKCWLTEVTFWIWLKYHRPLKCWVRNKHKMLKFNHTKFSCNTSVIFTTQNPARPVLAPHC